MSNKMFMMADRMAANEVKKKLQPILRDFDLCYLTEVEKKQLFPFRFVGEPFFFGGNMVTPVVVELAGGHADRLLSRKLDPTQLTELGMRVEEVSFPLTLSGVIRRGDVLYLASELAEEEAENPRWERMVGHLALAAREMDDAYNLVSARKAAIPSLAEVVEIMRAAKDLCVSFAALMMAILQVAANLADGISEPVGGRSSYLEECDRTLGG